VTDSGASPQHVCTMPKHVLAFLLPLLAVGCAGTLRVYPTPLSPGEGEMMVPALLTACQQEGVRAWRGLGGSAVADLGDGTYLGWQQSMDHSTFELHITLPGGIPEPEMPSHFDSAKGRADRIWSEAVELRRQSSPAFYPQAAQVPPPAATGPAFSVSVPGLALAVGSPSYPPSDCRLGSDGQRVCGYDCRVGSDGRVYCASTPDGSCRMNSDGSFSCGRACQLGANGFFVCQ